MAQGGQDKLLDGYRTFREQILAQEAPRWQALAAGQRPEAMVISCCDSRVPVETIFNRGPGDLFIVRNVANLVPPYSPDSAQRAASAAIEFAVLGLQVPRIIVLGHSGCGGVQALIDATYDGTDNSEFIHNWMTIARPVRDRVLKASEDAAPEQKQRAVEHASIVNSLGNLRTFPFVTKRENEGKLQLDGFYFDIERAQLWSYDAPTERFHPVD
jgi:carbonic anhydrase